MRHTARLYPVARTLDLPADEPVDPVLIGERGDLLIAWRLLTRLDLLLIWLLSLAARGACPVGRAQWRPARRDATRAVQRHECSSGDERNEHRLMKRPGGRTSLVCRGEVPFNDM